MLGRCGLADNAPAAAACTHWHAQPVKLQGYTAAQHSTVEQSHCVQEDQIQVSTKLTFIPHPPGKHNAAKTLWHRAA
jgi:hypothetical protein